MLEKGSYTNQKYALRDLPSDTNRPSKSGLNAAREYLRFVSMGVDLRQNYIDLVRAIAEQLENGIPVKELMGFLDAPKLTSSLQLFERVSENGYDDEVCQVCQRALKCIVLASKGTKRSTCSKEGKKSKKQSTLSFASTKKSEEQEGPDEL